MIEKSSVIAMSNDAGPYGWKFMECWDKSGWRGELVRTANATIMAKLDGVSIACTVRKVWNAWYLQHVQFLHMVWKR